MLWFHCGLFGGTCHWAEKQSHRYMSSYLGFCCVRYWMSEGSCFAHEWCLLFLMLHCMRRWPLAALTCCPTLLDGS